MFRSNPNLIDHLRGKYHPSNAVKRTADRSFSTYTFKDGSKLKVRTKFERKLFYPKLWRVKRFIRLWKAGVELPTFTRGVKTAAYDMSGIKVITRTSTKPFKRNSKYAPDTIDKITSILGSRVRIEPPLFELITSDGKSLLGTRELHGQTLETALIHADLESQLSLVGQVAKTMAKLHARGLTHGHMHGKNVFVSKGKLILTDPKYIQAMKIPTPEQAEHDARSAELAFDFMPISSQMPNEVQIDVHLATHRLSENHAQHFIEQYIRAYRKEYEKRART